MIIGASLVVVVNVQSFPLRAKVVCQLTIPLFVLFNLNFCYVSIFFGLVGPPCVKRDCLIAAQFT